MKQSTFFSIISLALICLLGGDQANATVTQNFNDTIRTPPTGIVIKDGRLMPSIGYKIRYSANGVGNIYRVSDGRVMYTLECTYPECTCRPKNSWDHPSPCTCCPAGPAGHWIISIGEIGTDGKTTWKILVIPKTNITTTSN